MQVQSLLKVVQKCYIEFMNSLIFIVGKNSRKYVILEEFQNEDTGHISEWFSESWRETHSGEAH